MVKSLAHQSGIAIIEISLLHGGRPGNVFNIVGKHGNKTCKKMNISKSDVSLTRLHEDEVATSFTIIVDITNTTVDMDILHQVLSRALHIYPNAFLATIH